MPRAPEGARASVEVPFEGSLNRGNKIFAMIKISSDTPGRIKVTFSYNPEYVARIKTIEAHRWHPDEKYWSFPRSKPVLEEILSVFAGEDLDIDPSLQTLVSQDHREKSAAARPWRKGPPTQWQETDNEKDPVISRVRDLIRLKHYSIRTEKSYLSWITRYISFHNKRDPKEMANPEIEAFLSHLAVGQKVSAATQNQAFNALLFLYKEVLKKELDNSIDAIRAKKPKRLPTVMTKEEAKKVIGGIPGDHQLMVKLIYGGGLRLMECLRLRVKDIDFGNNQLVVRDAKGMKDRVTLLPDSLKPSLKEHLERVKMVHQNDVAKGYGRVYLPYALERKYPSASLEWGWQYVFPAKGLSKDPRTEKPMGSDLNIERGYRGDGREEIVQAGGEEVWICRKGGSGIFGERSGFGNRVFEERRGCSQQKGKIHLFVRRG